MFECGIMIYEISFVFVILHGVLLCLFVASGLVNKMGEAFR